MTYELNKIMQSLIINIGDSAAFLLMIFFYGLIVLQLPVKELVHMVGVLIFFAFVINFILHDNKQRSLSR